MVFLDCGVSVYGAKRVRTADPYNAIVVLYQLSYNPLLLAFSIMPQLGDVCQAFFDNLLRVFAWQGIAAIANKFSHHHFTPAIA